jgi:hypothetical protein
VEPDEGDQRFGAFEPERDPGQQSDLGVDRFDPAIGQPVGQGVGDVVAVAGADPVGQIDERSQPAGGGPVQPRVEQLDPLRAAAGELRGPRFPDSN